MSQDESKGKAGLPLYVYFDGLCEPRNPGGVATYGIVIQQGNETIHEESGLADAKPYSQDASNNVAEYSAIIRALEYLDKNSLTGSEIVLRGDSRLIINQLTGVYKVKSLRIIDLHHTAKKLIQKFKNLRMEWVNRELNQEADELSRIAYKRYLQSQEKT